MFQRLSHLYDAITVGTLAGHEVDLPNIYCQPIQGAIAYIGGDCLHLISDRFAVTFHEAQGGGCMEDRLLIAWTGDEALCEWLDAVETAHYPFDFLTGNRPFLSPPPAWYSFTLPDEDAQAVLEREMLLRSATAWGYKTQSAADEDDNIVRTYFFESVADATYARLIV